MKSDEYLLSVVAGRESDTVYIHADDAGLARLANVIEQMRARLHAGRCEDAHLYSGAWGPDAGDLTQTMLQSEKEAGAIQVHHLKIYGWTDEWRRKQAL